MITKDDRYRLRLEIALEMATDMMPEDGEWVEEPAVQPLQPELVRGLYKRPGAPFTFETLVLLDGLEDDQGYMLRLMFRQLGFGLGG